jgi:hypothetical protein
MEKNKDLLTLILALSLPVLLILVLGLYLYLPRFFVKPTEKFLYYVPNYSMDNFVRYQVKNGRVAIQPDSYNSNYSTDLQISQSVKAYPDIFLYDTATDQKQKLNLEQAMAFALSKEQKSPAGFEIANGSSGGDFLFGYSSNNYRNYYLTKNAYSKKLSIDLANDYNNLNFLGWVEE